MNYKTKLLMFLLFCLWGPFWEFSLGALYALLGNPLWTYPESIFKYTCWKVAPLWGVAGMQGATFYEIFLEKDLSKLRDILVLIVLAIAYVFVTAIM